MLETIFGQLLSLIWFTIRELIGYLTGKAIIQGLSPGRLSVAELRHFHKNPFSLTWRTGRQRMVTGSVAVGVGYLFWFIIFITSIYLLGR